MRIAPLDIQQKQFPVRFKGFDVEEVSAFLEVVREEMEDLIRDKELLTCQLYRAEHQDQGDTETTLRETLVATQKIIKAYMANVSEETELLLERLKKQCV